MKIAVASGKGGTGKTTIAVNLAKIFAMREDYVYYCDCDVEAPNGHLFLAPEIELEEEFCTAVPQLNQDLCDGCGKCSDICNYGAIAVLRKNVVIYPELCHSCGGCMLVCPHKALSDMPRPIGTVQSGNSRGLKYVAGRLTIGEASAVPLIKDVKRRLPINGISIIDSPPGTSCPVIETMHGTDFVILVTEPTPFGHNDLMLAVETVRKINLPFGVVINRSDIGDNRIIEYCLDENIDILATIPFSREVSEKYAYGKVLVETIPEQAKFFIKLAETVKSKILNAADRNSSVIISKSGVIS